MKNKILYILICLIIIIGIAVWATAGFNKELQFSKRDQLQLSNNTGIEVSDIEEIASEVLGNTKYFIQRVETFGNSISIIAEEITDEQKEEIIEKFNEKYDEDISSEDVEVRTIGAIRVKNILKNYVLPGVITLILVLLYFLIRYRKLNWKLILAQTALIPIISEMFLFSVIAICRIPFGRITIGIAIGIYVGIIAILTNKFEKQKDDYKKTENKGDRKED